MNYGCKNGLPHAFETFISNDGTVCDFVDVLIEICTLCGKKTRWNKNKYNGRIDDKEYLAEHIREFAQPYGRTGKVFEMLYGDPKKINIYKKGTNNRANN